MIDKIKKYITVLEKEAIPQLSINCVIFGFHEKALKVIVNKIELRGATIFVLPGGYVGQREDLTVAVERIVKESTGLEKILFKQFAVFGDASRSFAKEFETLAKSLTPGDREVFKWFSKRFVSVCYLALVDFNKIELKPTQFLETAQWLPVNKAKTLAMDHSEIVRSARESLLKELPYSPIASNLLPARFTLPELHALVEAILGRTIDRPNFRRKILKSDLLVKVGQDDSNKRRPADLYMFKFGKKTSLKY
jgi:8-oxo-dGTP diphosphatase